MSFHSSISSASSSVARSIEKKVNEMTIADSSIMDPIQEAAIKRNRLNSIIITERLWCKRLEGKQLFIDELKGSK